jgi:hypothetical protein
MTVLLYGVMETKRAPWGGTGLDVHPLRLVIRDCIAAVVSDVDGVSRQQASLRAYASIVDGLMDAGAVLPARYGSTATTDTEIYDMLGRRHTELQANLKRVRDTVEFAVHASPEVESGTRADVEEHGPGTAYLLMRLEQEQRVGDLAWDVEAAAGEFVRAATRAPRHALAYLVARVDGERFVAALQDAGLIVTGPWPPYNFVGQDGT